MVLRFGKLAIVFLPVIISGCLSIIGYSKYVEDHTPAVYEKEMVPEEGIQSEDETDSGIYYYWGPYYWYPSPYWAWSAGIYWWDPYWYRPCYGCYIIETPEQKRRHFGRGDRSYKDNLDPAETKDSSSGRNKERRTHRGF